VKKEGLQLTPGVRADQGKKSYPHPESLAQWETLKQKKMKNALICSGIGVVLVLSGGFVADAFGAIFAFVLSSWMVTRAYRVDKSDYYSLPHALDGDSEHRCIFCGSRGIYRQGQYKTNNTHSNCSKCQERLFSE
jgi:hypothetical protein